MLNKFWLWYEENLKLNVGFAALLFIWQLLHLFWLTGEVLWARLFSYPLFAFEGVWQYAIIAVDYTEIPALITVSLVYLNELRKRKEVSKNIWFLILLNSQWLHLFWLTDEFILSHLRVETMLGAHWLVWLAIVIDYLELPVIYDTVKKFLTSLNLGRLIRR